MEKRKNFLIVFLLIIVLVMSVGFALLGSNLEVSATGTVAGDWSVRFVVVGPRSLNHSFQTIRNGTEFTRETRWILHVRRQCEVKCKSVHSRRNNTLCLSMARSPNMKFDPKTTQKFKIKIF